VVDGKSHGGASKYKMLHIHCCISCLSFT
jgi:hypothetical protein